MVRVSKLSKSKSPFGMSMSRMTNLTASSPSSWSTTPTKHNYDHEIVVVTMVVLAGVVDRLERDETDGFVIVYTSIPNEDF